MSKKMFARCQRRDWKVPKWHRMDRELLIWSPNATTQGLITTSKLHIIHILIASYFFFHPLPVLLLLECLTMLIVSLSTVITLFQICFRCPLLRHLLHLLTCADISFYEVNESFLGFFFGIEYVHLCTLKNLLAALIFWWSKQVPIVFCGWLY